MSDVDNAIHNVKFRILNLFQEIDDNELNEIEKWISSQRYRKELAEIRLLQKKEFFLDKIASTIKKIVPFHAEMKSEKIKPPEVGDQADCTSDNTVHVDEFLYNDEQVETLVKAGKLSRQYCVECKSHNVKDLIFISHSMSIEKLKYMFKVLLPEDLHGKQILDVGSRIGAVIFSAYHLTNASSIVGVEMNKECCELQRKIVEQFSMEEKRVKVIHSDIMECKDLVKSSDVVIINVLDFFVDIEKHKQMWYFFKNCLKKGSHLITNRSMADTLGYLDLIDEFIDWLTVCRPFQMANEILFDMEEIESHELYMYRVN